MANDSLLKLLAFLVFVLFVCCYPFIFITTWLCEVAKKCFGIYDDKSIAGEVAVVTGGANGLGKEIAIQLAKRGCSIAIVDINYESAQKTAELLREKFSVEAKPYQVDVTNYEAVVKLNENVTKDLGPTTILINNAGILLFSNRLDPDVREVQTMVNVNLAAHFWTNRVFLPKMKELKRGYIVAIGSAAGLFPMAYNSVYTATKFAVRGLMRCLSMELRHENYSNIHTTTVCPSFLKTNAELMDLTREVSIDKYYPLIPGEDAAQRIVQGMLREVDEIVMPGFFAVLHRLFATLPVSLYNWSWCFLGKPILLGMQGKNI